MEYTRSVLRRLTKASDIEIHVSIMSTDYGVYYDVREYIVSLDQYGRGITFPVDLGAEIFDESILTASTEVGRSLG